MHGVIISHHYTLGLTEYIMITNRNYIHQVQTKSGYRLYTPLSGLKNAVSLDYHYR